MIVNTESFKYILVSLVFITVCASMSAQTYSTSASWKTTVSGDTIYMFSEWTHANVKALANEESKIEWWAFNEETLAYDKLLRTVNGLSDTYNPDHKMGVLCKLTSEKSVSETRVWVDVPKISGVQMSVDSIYCEGMDVTGKAEALPTRVYDSRESKWVDVAQKIVYHWYVADTLQLTTGQIHPMLESPMQRCEIKVVAFNQVENKAEAVDSVDTYGVKALFTSKVRERDVLNEIKSGDSYSAPTEIEFVNTSKGNVTVNEWVMGNVSRLYDKNPVYSFQTTGTYRVALWVTDEDTGCSSVDSTLTVNITDAFLQFPDVFTPNGDGVNDEFRPAYKSLKSYDITIYNRWGRKVYHSTDPSTGWDGKEGNAKAAEGVYMYIAEGDGYDKGVKLRRHGTITLVR